MFHFIIYHRDTQTTEQRNRIAQTKNDMSTQMTKIGVYVPNMTDKLMIPGKYTTADEHLDMQLRKVGVWDSCMSHVLSYFRVSYQNATDIHLDSTLSKISSLHIRSTLSWGNIAWHWSSC